MKYFFIPGRKWSLSVSEIERSLSQRGIPFVTLVTSEDVLIFDIKFDLDKALFFFKTLGGSIKVGFFIDELYEYLETEILPRAKENGEKVNFALSVYGKKSYPAAFLRQRERLGIEIKKWFRDNEIRSRFVSNPRHAATSSVLLKSNKVLEKGLEINMIFHPKTGASMWGLTLGIQDYEAFAKRDYGRPRSNKLKGMIPPKLARIMTNIAGIKSGGVIWDPFCGSGTILQEALLLGYKVIGTDIDPASISETKENLAWICEEYKISHTKYNVFLHDIKNKKPQNVEFDAIVSEPYLGPVQKNPVKISQVEEIVGKLSPIYQGLEQILIQKSPNGNKKTVVVVVPGFKTMQNDWIDMEVPFSSPKITDITNKVSRYPLQWDRPHSIIRRNIKIFEV